MEQPVEGFPGASTAVAAPRQPAPRVTRILIVDGEASERRSLADLLSANGFICDFASNATEACRLLRHGQFALLLCDVGRPNASELEWIGDALRERPDLAAVLVASVDDPELARDAFDLGATGYVVKPYKPFELLIHIENALRRQRLERDGRDHQVELCRRIRERTLALESTVKRLVRTQQQLRRSREETIHRLTAAAEFRHDETARHIQRMSQYCALLARRLGLDQDRCELIRAASPMHDIGKIGIPDGILMKNCKLTQPEFAIMKRHAEIGYRILAGSDAALLKTAAAIAWTHHERMDGSGYPRGLQGIQIPVEGRIAAIADTFDALTSWRSYQAPRPVEEAVRVLHEGRGRLFDPILTDCFIGSLDEIHSIMAQFRDS
jgi:putative two-component system response regulator